MKRSLALKMPFALAVISTLAFAAPPDTTGGTPNTNDDRGMRPGTTDTPRTGTDTGRTGTTGTGSTMGMPSSGSTVGTRPSGEKGVTLTKSDQDFVKDAANIGNAEVKIAQLAVSKSTNSEVKKFAQTMIDDHTKVNDELKSICDKKSDVVVPSMDQLSSAGQKNYDKLSDLSGDKFDREFVNIMISDHKTAIRAFEKESKKADAEDLKTFASKYLPALQRHLDQAQALERDIKARM